MQINTKTICFTTLNIYSLVSFNLVFTEVSEAYTKYARIITSQKVLQESVVLIHNEAFAAKGFAKHLSEKQIKYIYSINLVRSITEKKILSKCLYDSPVFISLPK